MALTPSQRAELMGRFKREVAKKKMTTLVKKHVPSPGPSLPPTPTPEPVFVGPPKPEPVSEPIVEPSPEQIKKVEQKMESLKGKPVVVTYRTPSGEIKRVQTTRFGKDYRVPGEFISVSPLLSGGGTGRAVLVGTGDITGPSLIARQRASYYQKGVPGWATEQVKVPSKIGKVGVGGLYQDISYRRFLGLDTAKQEKELETKMRSSRWYMGSQVKYAGKTFEQLKAEEPALYLKPDVYGMLTPEMDVKRWRKELHDTMNKTFGGSVAEGAKVISSSFLNIFDLGYWFAEDRSKYIYEKEYGHMKQIRKGDVIGPWVGSQIPAYANIIGPFAIGAGFGAGLGLVGRAGAGGAIVARGVPLIVGGAIVTTVGVDVGVTAAKQQTGDWVKDWTSRETLKKATGYGVALVGAGAGARWATAPGTKIAFHRGIEKTHLFLYKHSPTSVKQLGYNINQGVKNLRFQYAKTTGRGLIKPGEYVSKYVPGQWRWAAHEQYMGVKIGGLKPRIQKFLYTGRETIPLERYIPVRPGPSGRIFDVGIIKPSIPKIGVKPSPWFKAPRSPYWIKVTQPPKTIFRTASQVIKPSVSKGGPLTVITKDVGLTRGFTPQFKPGVRVTGGYRMPGGWALATGHVSLGFLDFLEEGTQQVSPRWGRKTVDISKIGLVVKPSVKTSIAKMFKPDIRVDVFKTSMLQPRSDISIRPDVKTSPMNANMWKQEFDNISAIVTTQTQQVKQQQVQIQTPIQIQIFKTPTIQKFKQPRPPKPKLKPRPAKTTLITLPSFPGGISRTTMIREPSSQGYQVHIKTRQYYHGKPKGPEKLRSLSRTVYGYNDARNTLGYVLDNSIAQTGMIKPVDRPISKKRRQAPIRFGVISYKFDKNGGRYTETRPYAIDTRGEKLQLNAFRVYGRLPSIKTKTGGFSVDMYGFDKLEHKISRNLRRRR